MCAFVRGTLKQRLFRGMHLLTVAMVLMTTCTFARRAPGLETACLCLIKVLVHDSIIKISVDTPECSFNTACWDELITKLQRMCRRDHPCRNFDVEVRLTSPLTDAIPTGVCDRIPHISRLSAPFHELTLHPGTWTVACSHLRFLWLESKQQGGRLNVAAGSINGPALLDTIILYAVQGTITVHADGAMQHLGNLALLYVPLPCLIS